MVKYVATAVALKCFSSGPAMRGLYRKLGNEVGNRRRSTGTIPQYYIERLKRMHRLVTAHQMLRDGDRVLELGTGWLHWEALTLKLFHDIEAVLYDVWDNRQLGGLRNYFRQLKPRLPELEGLSLSQRRRAESVIDTIVEVSSFDELYATLGFRYVCEPSGSLLGLSGVPFQLVVSAGVLEHVRREAVPTLLHEMRQVTSTGGWGLHSIDTSDHLAHYDRSVSLKKYLTFSEQTWTRMFDNEVQHINRIQLSEWIQMFRANGYDLVEEDGASVDISKLRIHDRYAGVPQQDLSRTVVRVALKAS